MVVVSWKKNHIIHFTLNNNLINYRKLKKAQNKMFKMPKQKVVKN